MNAQEIIDELDPDSLQFVNRKTILSCSYCKSEPFKVRDSSCTVMMFHVSGCPLATYTSFTAIQQVRKWNRIHKQALLLSKNGRKRLLMDYDSHD